jgi:hypothetical protein
MGKFQTADEAQRVGGLLQDILRQVAHWKQQDYEAKWQAYLAAHQIEQPTPQDRVQFELEARYEARKHSDSNEARQRVAEQYGGVNIPDPTAIEQQIAQKYGVMWPYTLDYARDPAIASQAVLIVDRAVIVAEDLIGYATHTGPWPFAELLEKLGAEVALASELDNDSDIQITIRCTAPDEAIATTLLQHIQQDTDESLNSMSIDDLTHEWTPGPHVVDGRAARAGMQFVFTYIDWEYHARYFVDLLDYLRAHGCTNIDYDFMTVP